MTWVPLLLADRSPSLRYLVLTELLGRDPEDTEVQELKKLRSEDALIATLISLQKEKGNWKNLDQAGYTIGGSVRATSAALMRLGYLGLGNDNPVIERAAEYLFSKQRKDGSWPLPERVSDYEFTQGPYTMTPVQTSIPLLGLVMCGYGGDPRAELAFDWLMEKRNDDGTWPAGKVGEVNVRIAGYRRLSHSKLGCRTNTTNALLCLAYHPVRRRSSEARQALDHLLGRETRERNNLGFNVARYIGVEPHRGALTYHAKFDLALILDICSKVGANRSDPRVEDLIDWILEQQGQYGLWEYTPHPEVTRWISFDILRTLGKIDDSTDWISTKKRKHFAAYPHKKRRF
ncbi:MAG: prenyltransferase/squalene oxidase repeat-containing protein [Candidatus Thorarchaeota archaeon]